MGADLMSDVAAAIMDAAERRMRRGGFNGFSFREIAADVGVKSSSVHYHFPTKEDLAAAVIKRYTAETAELIERELGKESNPIKVWVKAFRGTLHSQDRMCPCAVLGASSQDLPPEVAAEVKRFFKMCHEKLVEEGLPPDEASQLLSTITGALVVANAVNDFSVYDNATREFTKSKKLAPVKAAARRLK
jgi:TetR/AcrR family transcriptional regulator, transcriptional repressor for nem operon